MNEIERDPQAKRKMKDILDKYNSLPYLYQPKIVYDTLIQNVILEEIINLIGATMVKIDEELKKKTSRIKILESE